MHTDSLPLAGGTTPSATALVSVIQSSVCAVAQPPDAGALQQYSFFACMDLHAGEGAARVWLGFTLGCRSTASVLGLGLRLRRPLPGHVHLVEAHGSLRGQVKLEILWPLLAAGPLTFQGPKPAPWPSPISVGRGRFSPTLVRGAEVTRQRAAQLILLILLGGRDQDQ